VKGWNVCRDHVFRFLGDLGKDMGGFGSGWHRRHKIPVEYCIVLDSLEMAVRCFDLPNVSAPGRRVHGRPVVGLHFMPVGTQGRDSAVCIDSLLAHGRELILKQVIRFLCSRSSFGDLRWWFSCPRCGRRVAKVYLPPEPAEPEFACRECHQLTYRSVQTHQGIHVPAGLWLLVNFGPPRRRRPACEFRPVA